LAEQGFASASMASIALRAGVSVGTLYNYFKDKDQLLATILSVRRKEIAVQLDEVARAQAASPYVAHLEAFIRSLFQLFDQHRKFLSIVLETERLGRAEEDGEAQRKRTWLVERVAPIIGKGVAEGRLPRASAALYSSLYAGAIRGALSHVLEQPNGRLADEAQRVVSFFLGQTAADGLR
jgi:AcrR family transcriptional regulator